MEKDVEKFKSEVEYVLTSCMMSKNDAIRLKTYSKIFQIVNVINPKKKQKMENNIKNLKKLNLNFKR